MITVTKNIVIPDSEVKITGLRAGGPGGQHGNTTDTAVQLRFDLAGSHVLSDEVKERLRLLAGRRMGADGTLLITARRHRSRRRNVEEAGERLAQLVRRALVVPRKRRPTRPTAASAKRRLQSKARRSGVKRLRRKPDRGDAMF